MDKARPFRLLVVEDDQDSRDILVMFLDGEGYEVEEAATGQEALTTATSRPPSAILLDLTLPSPDGFEVCRQLRNLPLTAAVPVIALTGLELSVTERAAFDAWIKKPVDFDLLVRALDKLLPAGQVA
jgi:CheY-like chemotaxis protein